MHLPQHTGMGGVLGSTDKVFVDGCTHPASLLIGQVEHHGGVLLSPVLKPVHLDLSVVLIPKLVLVFPGVVPDTILIQTVVFCDTIVKIEGKNGLVQPLNIIELVTTVVGR